MLSLFFTAYVAIASAETWSSAQNAFAQQNHIQASELFEKVVQEEPYNGYAWYNLGNSFMRMNKHGKAIAAYNKAAFLLPRFEDIQTNLAYARTKVTDNIAPPYTEHSMFSTLFFWHHAFSHTESLWLLCGVACTMWCALFFRLWFPKSEPLQWLVWLSLVCVALLVPSVAIRFYAPQKAAVVVSQEASAFTSTNIHSPVRFTLHEGVEVKVLEQASGWVKIALPKGEQGWIPEDSMQLYGI